MKTRSTYFRILALGLAAAALTLPGSAWALVQSSGKGTGPKSIQNPQSSNQPAADAAAGTKQASSQGGAQLTDKDRQFMMDAAKDGMMEVEMGKMAQQKGQSTEVKNIGERMVRDHSQANGELMALAKRKGVDLSKVKAPKHNMSGDDFDKQYLAHMVAEHKKDVADFRAQSRQGSDPDIKQFAAKNLRVLEAHLKLVTQAQARVGGATHQKASPSPEAKKDDTKPAEKADEKTEGSGAGEQKEGSEGQEG